MVVLISLPRAREGGGVYSHILKNLEFPSLDDANFASELVLFFKGKMFASFDIILTYVLHVNIHYK